MADEVHNTLVKMAAAGDIDQLKTLLANHEPSTDTIQALLTAAAQNTQLPTLNFLLAQYPSVSLHEDVVRAAVNAGSVPLLRALLAHDPACARMPLDRRGTPLVVACMGRQRVAVLRCLLDAGADPNQDPDAAAYPLALAAALYDDTAVLDLLLRYGARVQGSGALAAAAQRGNVAMLRHLLECGARPDTDAEAGRDAQPLHVAVGAGRVAVARVLLQHGADVESKDARGRTAVEVAREMQARGEDMSEMLQVLGE